MAKRKRKTRRLDDRLLCSNCLIKGKRIAMRPTWKFDFTDDSLYLWFICPNKRKGETGCGHVSVREVKSLLNIFRKRREKRERADTERKKKTIPKRLKKLKSNGIL